MFRESSKDGFSFKVYQGAQMTLLTMDLVQQPAAGTFAGFTLEYTGPNAPRRPIKNLLNFAGTDSITSSVDSPFQAFKWVHFPGSYSQNPPPFGNWDYHATPRFFDANKKLLPLDAGKTVTVTIPVGDFSKGGLEIGFTRAFLKSQAYASHYGAKTKLKPTGDWLFDMTKKAGTKNGHDFTYADMYVWLGYTARRQIYEPLDEALNDNTVEVEMFAYDLNDPGVAQRCLDLAAAGRIRMILDNAALHHVTQPGKPPTEEDDFEVRFNAAAAAGFPRTEITFSPHDDTRAAEVLDEITALIQKPSTQSVLFAVMEMGDTSTGTLIRALRDLHKNDSIYTYGVTDNSSGDISLYKPGRKNGLLIDATQAKRELPPPFKTEASLPGHAIHHKFVITNFNRSTARVWCGSSNLALGGEKANGDNLICITDDDVATAFAIEAMRLTDHYNFRSVREPDIGPPNQEPKKLDDTGAWVNKFFDPDDIRFVEREVLA